MRIGVFSRAFFALWLAIAALGANAVEQRELGFAVIAATAQDAATSHIMPDGTVMAGPMGHSHDHDKAGGHTHKGHADCDLCGLVADMAAFTPAALVVFPLPPEGFAAFVLAAPGTQVSAAASPPYSSRAPPIVMS